MDEILIVGKADPEISEIRTVLGRKFSDHKIRFAKPDKASISKYLCDETRLAILNYQTLPNSFSSSIHSVRKTGFESSILMLAKEADPGQMRELRSQNDVTLLPKPFLHQDLTSLSDKILKNETVHQRSHARFGVQETVSFETFGTSGMTAAEMTRMSKGGALLRIQGHNKVDTGEIIQVHVQLRNLQRYHKMYAQVVYCESNNEALPGESFGLRWLSQLAQKQVA